LKNQHNSFNGFEYEYAEPEYLNRKTASLHSRQSETCVSEAKM
jgi:hypothetical protein